MWRDGGRRIRPKRERGGTYAILLVGVLWVLPMLALALLFSEGEGLAETGCRLVRQH